MNQLNVRYSQCIRAEFRLKESSSLQKEQSDVKGVDIGVWWSSSGHQLP